MRDHSPAFGGNPATTLTLTTSLRNVKHECEAYFRIVGVPAPVFKPVFRPALFLTFRPLSFHNVCA